MKLNNNQIPFINLSLSMTILICFASRICRAHTFTDSPSLNDDLSFETQSPSSEPAYAPEASQFSEPESSFSSPAEAPQDPASAGSVGSGPSPSPSPTSFSGSISNVAKRSLRGHSLKMQRDPNFESKPKDKPDLAKICGQTDYPEVCLSTISPLLPQNFDIINVLEASIKACSNQIKSTMAKASKRATTPEVAAAIADCKDPYNDSLESLQKALDAIPSRDLATITVKLSAVMADASTCESGFQEMKQHPLTTSPDTSVTALARNCMSIVPLIPH